MALKSIIAGLTVVFVASAPIASHAEPRWTAAERGQKTVLGWGETIGGGTLLVGGLALAGAPTLVGWAAIAAIGLGLGLVVTGGTVIAHGLANMLEGGSGIEHAAGGIPANPRAALLDYLERMNGIAKRMGIDVSRWAPTTGAGTRPATAPVSGAGTSR